MTKKANNTSSAICILAGGETIVNVTGTGRGGRNQEMALMAAIELHKLNQTHEAIQKHRVTLLCGGTDGQDGPTPAAGIVSNYPNREHCFQSWFSSTFLCCQSAFPSHAPFAQ